MDPNAAQTHSDSKAQEPSPVEALQHLRQQIEELQAYVAHFVSAHLDKMFLSAQQVGLWVILGSLALVTLSSLLVTALVLFLHGMAAGLGLLLGRQLWLGQMVVGFGVVVLLALGMWIAIRTWQRQTCKQTVQQYEERQIQQQAAFGHSAADQATAGSATPH